MAGFKADDPVETRLDKLEALLSLRAPQVQAVVPLFAELLSIPFATDIQNSQLSPAQQRRRTLAALLDQFESHSRKQPILLLIEDVHWADDTTLELLDLIVERARQLSYPCAGHLSTRVRASLGRSRQCRKPGPRTAQPR